MSAPSPIELLSRVVPISDEEAAGVFGEAGREGLLDAITRLTPRGRPARRRLRRRSLLVAAAAFVVVAAATGAGWALTHGSARDTTSIDCVIQGGDTIIEATSGDPAADCAAVWPSLTGKPAPPLQAYDDGLGGVAVLPNSEKAPASWTPIASQDVALIELQESFLDEINGLSSTCFDAPAATAFARQQLDRLGFGGWTVTLRTGDSASCVDTAVVEPTTKTVTLIGGGVAQTASSPQRQLATVLRPLTKECLSLAAMQTEVEREAGTLGFAQTAAGDHSYQLTAVRDDSLRCTALYETVGGTVELVLRGPAG